MKFAHYILMDKKPVKVGFITWADWMENHHNEKVVCQTEVSKGVNVSTVFLCMDYSYGRGDPLWFETMVFGGEFDQYVDRYTTWGEAEKGHELTLIMCGMVKKIAPK